MEELDFQGLLDRFGQDGFQKGEQVILANFGTNQTLLTLIFGVPVNIRLVDQRDESGLIYREVELMAGERLVCSASSQINKARNRVDVISDIISGGLGLGQIVVKYNLANHRELHSVGRDEAGFWRAYSIEGPEICLDIHEHFPRAPFEEIGWIHKKGSRMTVTDEGETFEFSKFVAIGVQDDGSVFLGIEDEGLTKQEAMEVVLQGAQVIGEIAGLIQGKEE